MPSPSSRIRSAPRRGRAHALTLGATSALLALGACDPCAGIVACEGGPVFRAGGWIVDHETGAAVGNVRVTFLPTDDAGTTLPPAVTAADGRWEASIQAGDGPSLVGRFRIEAPGRIAYETDEVTIRSLTRGGGEELGRWTTEPFLAFIGELWFADRRPRTARVDFVRTGGARLAQGEATVRADAFGRFLLELDPLDADTVVGDLTVRHADLPSAFTIRDVRMPFKYKDELLPLDRVLEVGPSLAYLGVLWRRSAGTRIPAEGVATEFRRIGGISASPVAVSAVTIDWGAFSMTLRTFQEGTVRGVVTAFLPPSGDPVVLDTVSLSTFDPPGVRFGGEWLFGPQINYRGGLRAPGGGPIPNARVTFVRTGGIVTEPTSFESTTDAEGHFFVRLHVEASGEVEGELRISLPDGGTTTLTGVRLEAREDDDLHFLGWVEP